MKKSNCSICGNKKSRFVLQGLNTPRNRIKMPCGMVLDNKL